MAKKDDKKSKKKDTKDGRGVQQDALDTVRAAFERTLQVTAEGAQSTQKRTQQLVDEVQSAAARLRQAAEDVNLLEDVKALRDDMEQLARRVAALEVPGRGRGTAASASPESTGPSSSGPGRSSSSGTTRARTTRNSTSKPASSSRSGSTGTRRSAAAKSSSTASKAKGTTSRSSGTRTRRSSSSGSSGSGSSPSS